MAGKLRRLFERNDDSSHAGIMIILILICLFFPILSLLVVKHVIGADKERR